MDSSCLLTSREANVKLVLRFEKPKTCFNFSPPTFSALTNTHHDAIGPRLGPRAIPTVNVQRASRASRSACSCSTRVTKIWEAERL